MIMFGELNSSVYKLILNTVEKCVDSLKNNEKSLCSYLYLPYACKWLDSVVEHRV